MSEIIMPKMGDAMTEGKVIRWYKKAGDAVKKGEPVLEIETDKVNLDLEAEADGIIEDVAVEEGSMAPVGAVLAMIGTGAGGAKAKPKAKEEKSAEAKPAEKPKNEKPEAAPAKEAPAAAKNGPAAGGAVVQMPQRAEGRVKSSPLARRIARDRGVDLAAVSGSGPMGRIIVADVEKHSQSKPAAAASAASGKAASAPKPALVPAAPLQGKDVPLTAMRRTIAKRLAESTGPIPHFYLTIDVDVTELLSVRKQLNEIAQAKVSVNDFIIRAAALALRHHPEVNASWGDEAIRQHGEISVGVAVATPEGLITPVIRNADQRDVVAIATEVRALADKAKSRKLKPEEYQGATFTISNLGMFGIEEFTAIINPPNSAILAVGAAQQKPVVIDGQVVVRDRMKITMSCDHRVIDGAIGAQYLATLRQYIEQPLRVIV
jgi:pyruvate dehydrogenase E2 component (dihydrolipoamide acetyltransferase)